MQRPPKQTTANPCARAARGFAAFAAATAFLSASPIHAASLPAGFSETTVASGLSNPTLLSIAPDGRVFVSEQGGRLRVIKNGSLLSTPFLTLSGVSTSGERGLLGVAFDPDFGSNRYLYVYWTSTAGGAHNQVSRFQASESNPDVVEEGSEEVLLRLPNLGSSNFHNGGALQFREDGKLYVAVGENNQSSTAQRWDHTFGKILRINTDGTIPEDNPNYDTQTGINRAAWARGFRNPFTMAVRRSTDQLFVNDVGDSAQSGREEVNIVTAGSNYNWPRSQGAGAHYSYTARDEGGCAIVGGDFYEPSSPTFPSAYRGKYFFADYCAGWIRFINPSGAPTVTGFATGISSPTDVEVASDGSLYYIARGNGAVRRVQFGSGPTITQQPQSQSVSAGASVTFTCAATGTGTISYQWQRNNSNIGGATSSSYTFTANAGHNGSLYRCLATDSRGTTASNNATLTVLAGQPPVAVIDEPAAGTLYSGGETICYSGHGSDAEDGALPPSALTWTIVFHHDTHTHPFLGPISGTASGCFEIPTSGETSSNVWYRIHLTAQDSDLLSANAEPRNVMPRKSALTIATSPEGLPVTIDGVPAVAPTTITSVVGIEREIGTSSPQGDCEFQGWSDGGAQSHIISTPLEDTTYTATFGPEGCTPNLDVYLWPEAESGSVTSPMQKLNDGTASGGQYAAVAAGNNSQGAAPANGHLTIPFNVPTAGSYKVWARVIAPTSADDSFWVRVDSGAWINWNGIALGGAWHWDDVHDAASGNAPVTFTLGAGAHTLTIAYREDGTRVDRVLITNDADFTPSGAGPGPGPTPGPAYIYSEPEAGAVTSPMEVQGDSTASGGQYVVVAPGNNSQAAAPSSGHATVTFNVTEAGTYKVWARVIAVTNADDSFWVRMDGGAWTNWNNIPVGAAWHWDDVHNASAGNVVMTYTLSAGTHTLAFAYREDGAQLDRVLITNDLAFTPTGLGQ